MKDWFKGLAKKAEEKAKETFGADKVDEIKAKASIYTTIGKSVISQAGQVLENEAQNVKETISKELSEGTLIDKIFGKDKPAAEAPFTTDVQADGSFTPPAEKPAKVVKERQPRKTKDATAGKDFSKASKKPAAEKKKPAANPPANKKK